MATREQRKWVIMGCYQVVKKIGEGAFGAIYMARNIIDGSEAAVKVESVNSNRSQLLLEARFILDLISSRDLGQEVNIPNVFNIGKEGNYNVMVMDLLGPSLQELLTTCDRRFTLKTTLLIAVEILQLIEFVHSRGLLHRDIKPDNFLIGRRQNANKIFMIDFGLAKKYTVRGKHIPYRDNKDLTGTARYASLNTHLGIEQSRRDDLETLIYVLIYFLKGSLPWQNMGGATKKEKYDRIMEKKCTITLHALCDGLPVQFHRMLSYVRGLAFTADPSYAYLSHQLHQMARQLNYDLSTKDYDWLKPKIEPPVQANQPAKI